MRALAVLLLVLATGCNHLHASYTATSTTSAGTVASSSGGGLYVQGGALGVLILGGVLLSTVVEGEPPTAMFSDVAMRPAPAMKADRAVNEQDCTKPIDLSSGNLRCR